MSDASSRLSAEDAAQRLGVGVDEILNLRRRGKIRGYPDYGKWVFDEADVVELAAEMGVESTTSDEVASEPASEEPTKQEEPPGSPLHETTDSPYQPASLQTEPRDKTNDDEPGPKSSPYVPAAAPSSAVPTTPSEPVESAAPLDPPPPAAADAPAPTPPGDPDPPSPSAPASPARTLAQLISSDQPIDSARIIEALAERHGVNFDQAAGVVDGFWDHLLNPDHYRLGRRKLPMPHFGTFGLNTNPHGETELHFVSKPISELRLRRSQSGQHQPSTAWIDHWESNPPSAKRRAALSLKRRLSVDISADTGLNLRTTFLILWDLVETITGIMTGSGVEIRWAKRGVMKPQSPDEPDRYEFRTYKRLRDRLPALPAPTPKSTRRRKRSGQSGSGGCGIVLAVLLVLGLGFAICSGITVAVQEFMRTL
ncbi:MAG TPA: hypothetical protein DCE47_23860 [Planctomycetaceae bacterium]|nr:hypothetical protein [Planctomycetaceae bacterium]